MTNADIARSIIRSCAERKPEQALPYIHDEYREHYHESENGRDAFVKNCKRKVRRNTLVHIRRVISDGDYVAVQSSYSWRGDMFATFDIFKFDGGFITEHWGAAQSSDDSNLNDHTMTDGPVHIEDTAHTAENKDLVRRYITDIYIEENIADIDSFVSRRYIEHETDMRDGRDNFKKDFTDAISDKTLKYEKLLMVLGQGNFILSVCEGDSDGERAAFYDLFRLHECKIVEHWSVIQAVPEKQPKSL